MSLGVGNYPKFAMLKIKWFLLSSKPFPESQKLAHIKLTSKLSSELGNEIDFIEVGVKISHYAEVQMIFVDL